MEAVRTTVGSVRLFIYDIDDDDDVDVEEGRFEVEDDTKLYLVMEGMDEGGGKRKRNRRIGMA